MLGVVLSGATPPRVRSQTIDVSLACTRACCCEAFGSPESSGMSRGVNGTAGVRIMAPIYFSTASCRGLASPFTPAIMSRHPSPGPSSQPAQPPPSISARQKPPKPYPIGIAAGAEDVKYQTKYKELKRKVKDIESVRLHVCVL